MPDVVVVRVPKDEWAAQAEEVTKAECARSRCSSSSSSNAPPSTVLSRLRRVLGFPLRLVKALLARLWRRLFGPRPKP